MRTKANRDKLRRPLFRNYLLRLGGNGSACAKKTNAKSHEVVLSKFERGFPVSNVVLEQLFIIGSTGLIF